MVTVATAQLKSPRLGPYLEEGAVQQLLPAPDNGVLVLVLPLECLGETLDQGGQRTARKTLKIQHTHITQQWLKPSAAHAVLEQGVRNFFMP